MKRRHIYIVLGIFVLATIIYLLGARNNTTVTSFEECVEAGYSVLDSDPEQCETPDGEIFIRESQPETEDVPADITEHVQSKSDLIVVDNPDPLSEVSSPLTVTGKARGTWYFEGDFPIVLVDWDGRIIAESYASAQLDPNDPDSTWMTEDFVSFEGIIEFETPEYVGDFSHRGALIFQKDNPSDLPEHDDALEIPVIFEQ